MSAAITRKRGTLPQLSDGMKSMLAVDMRRMLTTSRFWIMLLIALLMPVLILTMTTMMDGSTVVNQQTGEVSNIHAFSSAWQIIGTEGGLESMMSMDITGMCNINLIFFLAGVFVCLFVSDDFRSGYAKNLFNVRANKGDYVMSKTMVGWLAGAAMLIAFFLGAVIGGNAAGLPFALGNAGVLGLVMCMTAKIFLMGVFMAIAVLVSVFGKQRSWLSILLFAFAGMLLFLMIPMLTPLNAGLTNVVLCLAGGVLFALGLGKISGLVLNRQDLV